MTKSLAVDEWDSGKLGQEEKYAKRADPAMETALDDALGLQMISIRLPKQLIEDLKFIAKHNAVGYQPLMRDILMRFAKSEKRSVLREQLASLRGRLQQA